MVIAPELEVRDGKPSFMIAQAAGDLGAVVGSTTLLELVRLSWIVRRANSIK
jgi:hypothetical protein